MASSVYFQGEIWPIFYVYGKSELGSQSVVKAPIDILMLGGKQYVSTVGSGFPTVSVVNNAQHDAELKWRSEFGPICIGKAQIYNASQFGDRTD